MPNDTNDLPSFPMPSNTPVDNAPPPTIPQPESHITMDTLDSISEKPESSANLLDAPPSLDEMTSPTPFTSPPQDEEPEPITDPIAPEITAPIATPTISTPTPEPTPVYTAPVSPPPAEIPATVPSSSSHPNNSFPIAMIFLLVLAVASATGAFFFYQQTQKLQTELSDITNIVEKQRYATPTPTATPEVTTTPTPTYVYTTPTPTATASSSTEITKIYDDLSNVFDLTSPSYPKGKLILITAENANNPSKINIKYWFRIDAQTKKYFYVNRSPNTSLQLIDQQVYVTPDDDIPSLNELYTAGTIGIDLDDALSIANAKCTTPATCKNSTTKAQVIRTSTGTIWQITYQITGQAKAQVIQIDANSKKILYQSSGFTTK